MIAEGLQYAKPNVREYVVSEITSIIIFGPAIFPRLR